MAVASPVAAAELRFAESRGTVAVHGLPAAALLSLAGDALAGTASGELLTLRTAAAGGGLPAVLGRLAVVDGELRFTPRLPLRHGLAYRATFDGELFDRLTGAPVGATADLGLTFEPPLPEGLPAARVEAVYPSAEVVPENLLRVYVWFSTPMRRRGISRGIRLVDAVSEEPVDLPFVEIEDGLWDPSGRRLTLFLHPGRVKRGVGPRLALGPPLRRGGRYRLEIDAGLRDAGGRPLATGHVKSFQVGPPDRRSPEPERWRLSPPGKSRQALRVELIEPLDHALLGRLLQVHDARGRRVAGGVEISHGERRWEFRPESPWAAGEYQLRVSTALEDLAGNTPERLFDEVTEAEREPAAPTRGVVPLPFRVTAAVSD